MQTFAGWVQLPETASAYAAVWRATRAVAAGPVPATLNPLYLHGPAGSGKSHLAAALIRRTTRSRTGLVAAVLSADALRPTAPDEPVDALREAHQADLLVLEDLQRLPDRAEAALADLLDQHRARGRLVVLTASGGPAQLGRSARLTSRCATGLVVGLLPLSPASRLVFLQDRARRSRLDQPEALAWLADRLHGSARELEGALNRLGMLTRLLGRPPGMPDLEEHFRPEAESHQATVEGIVHRVGHYFHVAPGDLRAPGRARQAVLPRQVGMYLARRLTPLSLQQIGAYFGGRDHTTVLHACRKVEQALTTDAALEGAVRRLHAELA